MDAVKMPAADAIRRLLGDSLMGKNVALKPSSPAAAGPKHTAVYVADDGKIMAFATCDLALAASVGAALCMIAPNVAAEAVRAGKLTQSLAENVHEVLNIMASLFMVDGGNHVRLRDVEVVPPPLAADVAAALAKATRRLDLDVTIAGYALGKLSLQALP